MEVVAAKNHQRPTRQSPGVLKRWWNWERTSGKFLMISIGAHVLFGLIAAVFVVQHYQTARKLTFKGGPPSPNPSTRALEHKVQMAKKQSTMTAPAIARKITTTGISKVTLPEMPAMPKLAAPPVKMAGAGGTDVSFNAGTTAATGGSGAGGAAVPFFGFRESRGGGSLVGKFYDLKQLKNGTPSKLDQNNYPGEISKFVNSGWNESNLDKYFVSPNALYTTQIFIPKINADQGPVAFGLGGRVQPKMWIVHYKGNVIPTETGTFRFVGMADDVLVVRFNGRVVLDCGSTTPSGHGPQSFYPASGLQLDPKKMDWYKGLGRGDPVQVTAGESYPMEVLMGEWPGGEFKAWLMIEKDGVQYEKDAKGTPILPIFKLAAGDVTRGGGEAPVFAKAGPVWKAEKAKESETPEKK
ncbi:MAG: hypothetical protein ACJ8M1_01370 [Chthoniobacterales bacterium]